MFWRNFSPFLLHHIFRHRTFPYQERENNRARKLVCLNKEGGLWDPVTEQSQKNRKKMHTDIRGQVFWFDSRNIRYRRGQSFSMENPYDSFMLLTKTLSLCMLTSCFWGNLCYFYASRENYLDVSSYDHKSWFVTLCFLLIAGTDFQHVITLYLKHFFAINTMPTFISIQNINK